MSYSPSALPRVKFQVKIVTNDAAGTPPPAEVTNRARDLGPFFSSLPAIIREGGGSVGQQIDTRTHLTADGQRRPWVEPWYAQGSQPAAVKAGEQVMWDAVRGRGPGAITIVGPTFAGIAVDDRIVRERAAALGNQIVSTASYFEFVTGNWQARTEPARAVPTKPVNRGSTSRKGPKKKVRLKEYSEEKAQYAMFWFLLYNFGVELTTEELLRGVPTPPKNMGWNPKLLERIRVALGRYVVGANYADRGDFFDPRRGGGGPIPARYQRTRLNPAGGA